MNVSLQTGVRNQIGHSGQFDWKAAIRDVNAQIKRTLEARDTAVNEALICGQMLLEVKSRLGHMKFMPWVEENCKTISHRTATRWMDAAERVFKALGLPTSIPVKGEERMPLSAILSARSEVDLPKGAVEARQLLFDFTAGKTMKECLAGVAVEGDEPHRITRAHNGATKGGHNGEDRKAYEKFIKKGLRVLTTHFAAHKNFTPSQWDAVEIEVKRFCESAPEVVVSMFRKGFKK
jgi:hypothetical protein